MRLLILYRPNSEQSTELERYLKEFTKLHPDSNIELKDIDSPEGVQQAELYDIMRQPALLVIDSEGKLVASWVGELLPLMDEVSGYLNQ